MRLIYVDESGISTNEACTVVAGIVVKADKQWRAVANYVAALVKEFIREEHRVGFVFHATELFAGTGKVFGDRNKYPVQLRCEALKALLSIPAQFHLALVFGINPKVKDETEILTTKERKWAAERNQASAFLSCVLAAEKYMRTMAGRNEIATLVAENNNETRAFVRYMHLALQGRAGEFSKNIFEIFSKNVPGSLPIQKIIDTVHFVRKRDAVLLQIADVCAVTIRYHFEKKPNMQQFFGALTENKPHRLKIGTGQRSGWAIVNFSRLSSIRMYGRVFLPLPWKLKAGLR